MELRDKRENFYTKLYVASCFLLTTLNPSLKVSVWSKHILFVVKCHLFLNFFIQKVVSLCCLYVSSLLSQPLRC